MSEEMIYVLVLNRDLVGLKLGLVVGPSTMAIFL